MRKFQKEELCNRLDEEDYVADLRTGENRWHECRRMIFLADDGKYYAADYERGLTEMQDAQPFEYEPAEIACHEMEPYERVVKDWRRVVGDPPGAPVPEGSA